MTVPDVRKLIWGWLTNRAVSTYLLIGMTVVLIVGSLLPNPSYMAPGEVADLMTRRPLLYAIGAKYNGQMVANSYFFGVMGIFLVISAACCSIDRLTERLLDPRPCKDSGIIAGNYSQPVVLINADGDYIGRFVTEWLRRRIVGAEIITCADSGLIIAKRGRFGFWGSILFHLILITVLIGMSASFLGGTRGRISFTEGQRHRLERSSFRYLAKEPVWGITLPAVELELLSQKTVFDANYQETAIEHLARFQMTDLVNGRKSVHDVRINEPLKLNGFVLLLMNGGFSPRFIIADKERTIFDSFVALSEEQGTKDRFTADSNQLMVEVRFSPDFVKESDLTATKSLQLKNPAVEVNITRQGMTLFRGVVPLAASVQFAGYTLVFPEVRRWTDIQISREPGMGFFFIASFFGLIGLFIRMFDPDEEFIVRIKPESDQVMVEFASQSRSFPALQAEMSSALANDLEALEKASEKGVL